MAVCVRLAIKFTRIKQEEVTRLGGGMKHPAFPVIYFQHHLQSLSPRARAHTVHFDHTPEAGLSQVSERVPGTVVLPGSAGPICTDAL